MRRITQLVLIWMAGLVSGCSPVAKLFYGVKSPDFESESSITQFASELGLPEAPMMAVSFDTWKSGVRLQSPDVYVFNKEGFYIPYKDPAKPNCSGPAELFLSYLDPLASYHFSNEYTVDSFYNQLRTLSCYPVNSHMRTDVDFMIFVTFNKWQGKKFQEKKTLVWLDSLKHNNRIKYELVFVNDDLQDCWDSSQKALFEKK